MTEGTSIVNTKEYLKLLELEVKWKNDLLITDLIELKISMKDDWREVFIVNSFSSLETFKSYFKDIKDIRTEYETKTQEKCDEYHKKSYTLTLERDKIKRMSIWQFIKWRKEK